MRGQGKGGKSRRQQGHRRPTLTDQQPVITHRDAGPTMATQICQPGLVLLAYLQPPPAQHCSPHRSNARHRARHANVSGLIQLHEMEGERANGKVLKLDEELFVLGHDQWRQLGV